MKKILIQIVVLTLFPFALAFAVTPTAKEFALGSLKKFSTVGHPKSKGINMVLSYPNSWLAEEGERPNIVQRFFSDGGRGLEAAFVITKKLELPSGIVFSENDLTELFTATELKTMIPPGAAFIQARATKIEGLPAGIIEYSMRQERAGVTLDGQYISYMFIYGSTMVNLQFMVTLGQTTSPVVLARKMDEFRPLFFLIANSIVLPDKWK
jgi:hypothetical protein